MIQVFVTGGTFDKSYNYLSGDLYFENTRVPKMIDRSHCRLPLEIRTLMMKDSTELDADDIALIVDSCRNTTANKVVITHGTDKMVNTAEVLAKAKILNKTIILTGAMIPYAFGISSDGFFNLGCALAFVQTLKKNVYITMHGRCFEWDSVIKNTKKGFFEKL